MELLTRKSPLTSKRAMGSIRTPDSISKTRMDKRTGVLGERAALGDVSNVFRHESAPLPETDSIALVQGSGKKQRLMHPVRPVDAKVGTTNSVNGKAAVWTPNEDEALRNSVKMNNGRNWKLIAESVPNRSDVQCLHRWQKVLNPVLVKGYWTKEEDHRMIELVQMLGMKRWAAIARCLPGRNGKQCRERWCNHLDPRISRDPWSQEEDMKLFLAHSTWGNKWAEIAKILPGRSDNGVKNRWNTSVRKREKAMEQLAKSLHLNGPVHLQGHAMPTATHPELMVDGNAEQSGQEEVFQGFRSYSKVVLQNSPPNAHRIECSLHQIHTFAAYEIQEDHLMIDSYLNFDDR